METTEVGLSLVTTHEDGRITRVFNPVIQRRMSEATEEHLARPGGREQREAFSASLRYRPARLLSRPPRYPAYRNS